MKYLLVFIIALASTQVFSQDSVLVKLNGVQVLHTSTEDTSVNVIRVTKLKKKKDFTVEYIGEEKEKWTRTIALIDKKGNQLVTQTGMKFQLNSKKLKELLKTNNQLEVWTWSLPDDPEMQAIIRVRRVLLCTLVMK